MRGLLAGILATVCAGCQPTSAVPDRAEAVWGRYGISEGRLQKPRAMTIDAQDHLYIVDMTARIQVFDAAGNYLRGWETPAHENGKPTGLAISRSGNLLVADTHYYRVLVYSPEGKLLHTLGGELGHGPKQFGLVTHAIEDRQGNLYVAEYGGYDRIQKFSPQGDFLLQWGGHGSEPGQFLRPQKMAFDPQDRLWVTDACNHRIQVFDTSGKLLQIWGRQGSAPGELYYPYDLALADDGSLYVVEYGNHRVQHFTADGRSLGCWGTSGREPGQLNSPWALSLDHHHRLFVLDSQNHRVQQVRM